MNVLSQIGYGLEGASKATDEAQRQALGAEQIAQQGQRTQAGAMGLEDLQQAHAVKNATRSAAANAFASGKTLSGSLLDMSDAAAQRGDVATAQQYRDAQRQLEDLGAKDVVHAALVNPTAGDRPDIVKLMQGNERTRDVVSAQLDDQGNLTTTHTNGQPQTVNVGTLAERLGMVKPFEHVLPAGSTYVRSNPVNNTTNTFTAPPAEKAAAVRGSGDIGPGTFDVVSGKWINKPEAMTKSYPPHVVGVYNEDGTKVGEKLISAAAAETTQPGTATGATDTTRTTAKALPELKEVSAEVLKIPGMATKSDPNNPLDTHMVLTPEGAALMPKIEALVMANRKLPAHTAILVAMRGTPVRDANGKIGVQFGGQVYPLAAQGGTQRGAQVDRPQILAEELKSLQSQLQTAQQAGDQEGVTRTQANIDQITREMGGVRPNAASAPSSAPPAVPPVPAPQPAPPTPQPTPVPQPQATETPVHKRSLSYVEPAAINPVENVVRSAKAIGSAVKSYMALQVEFNTDVHKLNPDQLQEKYGKNLSSLSLAQRLAYNRIVNSKTRFGLGS